MRCTTQQPAFKRKFHYRTSINYSHCRSSVRWEKNKCNSLENNCCTELNGRRILLKKLVVSQPINKLFPAFNGKTKFHYRAHNSPTVIPVLSQTNPVQALLSYRFKFRFNIILRFGGKTSKWTPSGYTTTTMHTFLIYVPHAPATSNSLISPT
jgi:hypothetical protein